MSWKKFKTLCNSVKISNERIDFNKILAREFLLIAFGYAKNENIKIKGLFKFAFSLDLKPIIFGLKEYSLVATNFIERQDHMQLMEACLDDLDKNSFIKLTNLKPKLKINFLNIYKSIYDCKGLFSSKLSFKQIIYVISSLIFYRNIEMDFYNSITKIKSISTKKYLALNSSIGIETIFCQGFNNYTNIETYSLTHGQTYIKYKKFKPLDNINGTNITARNVVVWGEGQKRELVRHFQFPKKNVLVSGNPKYVSKIISIKSSFKSCIVMLPRKIYDKENIKLINILVEFNKFFKCKLTLKLHPSLNFKYYQDLVGGLDISICDPINTLQKELESKKFDFAITYNSTSYYEAMYYGILCFRYDNENDMLFGFDDKFGNSMELLSLINEAKGRNKNEIESEIEHLLNFMIGLGINNYRKILE